MKLFLKAGLSFGILAVALVCPVVAFEVAYWCCALDEALPAPSPNTPAPSLLEDGLWLAHGETLGTGVVPLWAGNFYSPEVPGRGAAYAAARYVVEGDPERRLRNVERQVRTAAVMVWLSRHRPEADLKHDLLNLSRFGSRGLSADDASVAFFGVGVTGLSAHQVASMASLSTTATRSCANLSLNKMNNVLQKLRAADRITAMQFEQAAGKPPPLSEASCVRPTK